MDNIRTATIDTFDSLVSESTGRAAVEFMSYGCVHCRVLEPVLQEVAASLAPSLPVYRVNVAVEQELAARFEIEGTPTIVVFLNGRELARTEGPSPHVTDVVAAITQPFDHASRV